MRTTPIPEGIAQWDIHAHILPGVDDGAQTMAESLAMVQAAKTSGVSGIVATPHLRQADQAERVRSAFDALCQRCGYDFLILGFEVSDTLLFAPKPVDLEPLCITGTPCILFELSDTMLPPMGWEGTLAAIAKDYHPIMAHPERVIAFQRDPARIDSLLLAGCELQVDAGSLLERPWSPRRRLARWLVRTNRAVYVASDAHTPHDYKVLPRALAKANGSMCGGLLMGWLEQQQPGDLAGMSAMPKSNPTEPINLHKEVLP